MGDHEEILNEVLARPTGLAIALPSLSSNQGSIEARGSELKAQDRRGLEQGLPRWKPRSELSKNHITSHQCALGHRAPQSGLGRAHEARIRVKHVEEDRRIDRLGHSAGPRAAFR